MNGRWFRGRSTGIGVRRCRLRFDAAGESCKLLPPERAGATSGRAAAQAKIRREEAMSMRVAVRLAAGFVAAAVTLGFAAASAEEAKKLKIGAIFDYSGPFAGGGSELHALGAKIIIDHFIKQGGVAGYQLEAIYADAQSKPDVAINEAVRLV